jgi:iron complex transport system permease protein
MKRRRWLIIFVALAVIAVAPLIGRRFSDEAAEFVFWQLRVPRVLVAALVGATLSLVGAVYQTLFSNPLATPGTVGTTAGATLAALAVIVFGAPAGMSGLPVVTLAAFVGALVVSAFVTMIAARGDMRVHEIILAGIACSLAATAIATGIQYAADSAALFAATQWSLGRLPQLGYSGVLWLTPPVIITAIAQFGTARSLDTMLAGNDVAETEGVAVTRVRAVCIGFGSLGVAVCVALCGPIGFVELIVPNFLRGLGFTRRRDLLPLSFIIGAAFLVACDTFARVIISGRELPVGVVTAGIGAPALLLVLWRKRAILMR